MRFIVNYSTRAHGWGEAAAAVVGKRDLAAVPASPSHTIALQTSHLLRASSAREAMLIVIYQLDTFSALWQAHRKAHCTHAAPSLMSAY